MRNVPVSGSLVLVACLIAGAMSLGGGNGVNASPDGEVFSFSEHFEYTPVKVPRGGEHYSLPLGEDDVVGLAEVSERLGLGDEGRSALLENGFAVSGFRLIPRCEDVVAAYKALDRNGVPILVTSGSLLHTYHVLFDDLLSSLESRHLYDEMWHVSRELLGKCLAMEQESEGELAEAARRNAAFLAVGLELMKPKEDQIPAGKGGRMGERPNPKEFAPGDTDRYAFEVPAGIADVVSAELDLISAHAGMAPSPVFIYHEDYSQYVPRGHYTASEKLKNYFRAMMWFGRMTMLLKGSADVEPGQTCMTCDAFISEYDARIQTLGALVLADLLGRDASLIQAWERTYRVTAFFVGFSDDLGPYEYIEAMNEVFTGSRPFGSYSAAEHGKMKVELAEYRTPKIYGGTGNCMIPPPFTPEQADKCLAATQGFRLMGQRFVPDSYIMSRLVAPYTGEFLGGDLPFTAVGVPGAGAQRVFPRGLDVMAVLGAERASVVLDELGDTNYRNYDKAFSDIKAEIDTIEAEDWNQNLYWNWLWSLKSLLVEIGPCYPAFMRTDAWRDRALKIALASWAELRHDTILYVKQSYTMALSSIQPPSEARGYVEPYPELYNRLLSMTRMMRLGLDSMGLLADDQERRLVGLESALERLVGISIVELRGDPLTERDNRYLGEFGEVLEGVLTGLDEKTRKTTMVADVHTDTNSGKVLEEAVGYVDLLVVAHGSGDGVYLAAGPELTYYEFKHPMDDRLTDEAWRELLKTDPPTPGW